MYVGMQNGISVHVTLSYVKIATTNTTVQGQGEIIMQMRTNSMICSIHYLMSTQVKRGV